MPNDPRLPGTPPRPNVPEATPREGDGTRDLIERTQQELREDPVLRARRIAMERRQREAEAKLRESQLEVEATRREAELEDLRQQTELDRRRHDVEVEALRRREMEARAEADRARRRQIEQAQRAEGERAYARAHEEGTIGRVRLTPAIGVAIALATMFAVGVLFALTLWALVFVHLVPWTGSLPLWSAIAGGVGVLVAPLVALGSWRGARFAGERVAAGIFAGFMTSLVVLAVVDGLARSGAL